VRAGRHCDMMAVVPEEFASTFGCEYCRDDQTRLYGHVTQIASDEFRRLILLCCPRCGALYENTPSGDDGTRRLTEDEARVLFGDI
jgi:hypothetical protein